MQGIVCNIPTSERVARLIIGGLLLMGLLLGLGKLFTFLLGITLIIEGIVGWCGIPILSAKLKLNQFFENKTPPTSDS